MIAKLNESYKLIEKYKNLAEISLEKLKEFECLNMDLDAKLVLSNKLVDDLKSENESLKMHAKCLIVELRSYLRDLSGSKFVPTCHHCGVISHIRP